jgi:DNA-binding response OmpR family regulator
MAATMDATVSIGAVARNDSLERTECVLVTVNTPRSILVVEDDDVILELITIILEEEGYAVACAAEPETALQLARERRLDLILLDLSLCGLPSEDLIIALRRLPNAMASIVIVSGRSDLKDIARRSGADAYVAKPFDVDVLRETIRAVLAARATAYTYQDSAANDISGSITDDA